MFKNKGFFYGIISAILFALLNVLVKINQNEFPAPQMMFMRGVCGIFLLTPLIYKEIWSLWGKQSLLAWVRFITGAIAVYCLFYNIQVNGAGFAVALSNVSSLFVVFFSIVFLKELLLTKEWVAVSIVLSGVFLLHSPFVVIEDTYGMIIGMVGALSGGIAMTALKKAAARFSSMLIVWGFSLACGVLSLLLPSDPWTCGSLSSAFVLILTGLFGVYGQVFLTKSYVHLPAIIASAINLSTLLWSVVFETLYFKTLPDSSSILSYILIFLGLNLLQIFQVQKTKPATS